MATMIQAFVKFGPHLPRQPTVRLDQLAERLAELTGLRPSQVMSVLLELQSALLHYCRRGAGLELPGIGYFRPSLRRTISRMEPHAQPYLAAPTRRLGFRCVEQGASDPLAPELQQDV